MAKVASSLPDLPDKYFLQVMVHCPFEWQEKPRPSYVPVHPGTLYDTLAERCFKARKWSTKSLAYVVRKSRLSDDGMTDAERKDVPNMMTKSMMTKKQIALEKKRWRAIFAIGLDHVSKNKSGWQKDVEAFLKFFRKEKEIPCECDFSNYIFSSVYCTTSDHMRTIGTIGVEGDQTIQGFVTKIRQIATETVPTQQEQDKEWAEQAQNFFEECEREQTKEDAARDRKRKKRGLGEVGTGEPAKAGKIFSVLYNPADDLTEMFDFADPNDKGWQKLAKLRENHDDQLYQEMTSGATRVGGLPHVPPDFKWPVFRRKALPFIAQLDLASIKSASQELLPKTGFLLFFALISNSEVAAPRVLYFKCPRKQLKLATPPKKRWKDWMGHSQYDLAAMSKFVGPGEKTKRKRAKEAEVAKLFGQPELASDLPGYTADHAMLDGTDWITLLTIYSRNNMQWSDSGELHFFARRSDLKDRNFDNTLLAIDSG